MPNWSQQDMLEVFGESYEFLSQKDFDAALKNGRRGFSSCLLDGVNVSGLNAIEGTFNFSDSRFLNCKFTNCNFDKILFNGAHLSDCDFKNIQALTVSFADADVYHTRLNDLIVQRFDAKGSAWSHGYMGSSILGNANWDVRRMNSFSFSGVQAALNRAPDLLAITMGGATSREVNAYREQVFAALTPVEMPEFEKKLADSGRLLFSQIYDLPVEDVIELEVYANDETNDPETQEWRNDLNAKQERLVNRWDKDYLTSLARLGAPVYNLQVPQSSTHDLNKIISVATNKANALTDAKVPHMIGGQLDPTIQPIVTILWSESAGLRKGQQMTLAEADALFQQLDAAHGPGYDKTKFRIDFTFQGELDSYEGRQDFRDGDGGLIDHIKAYHEYYAGPVVLKPDESQRKMLLTEFVPYLRLHCNLTHMEQKARRPPQPGETVTPEKAAYFNAVLGYVQECRPLLNQGQYQLPEPPKLSDFDQSLQDYKEQVQAEIAQEAADVGMTVGEYAANDYEPRSMVEIHSACHSNYTGMVAMVGADEKVYMGKAENYDNMGHYDNRDSSLCFISENTGIYHFLYGEGWVKSQAEMLDNGLTLNEYKEFAALQQGILSQFEQRREILFDGKPFDPLFSSQPVQEQAKAPAADVVETPVPVEEPPEAPAAEDGKTTAPTYYAINETSARRAKEAISFSDYRPGSATSEYRQMVDEAAQIAERQKKRVDPMYHDKIDRLLDTYCRKLAANMNHHNEIMARVPSVMIAGPSNFPVRKKEKQNAAMDSNMREWRDIQGLLDKIRSIGMGGISADDPDAVSKLQAKLDNLQESQETMKAVNAYYRKHKTLDGCPDLPPQTIEKLKADMAQGWHLEDKPFTSWALSNNSAEIRRVKARIESLTRKEQIPFVGWEFDGGKVEINREENRLQVFFDGKPDPDTRAELKGGGFRWSPSAKAWQRQLTDNAFWAADSIKAIAPLTGEKPTELQRKARREKPSIREQLDAAKSAPAPKQGQYQLSEPPKLSDFDQSLQDYKEQVQAEIAQEAADVGMTVGEYAANGNNHPRSLNEAISTAIERAAAANCVQNEHAPSPERDASLE